MCLLVDTNVFLDLVLQREGGKDALAFFVWCRKHKNKTFVTSMSLRDVEYVAMRSLHDKKKAKAVLADVYSLCTKVVGVSADSAIAAIGEDYKDYEDELLTQTAKENLLDAIVTNNVKDFVGRGVSVYTPRQIINAVTFVNMNESER